MSVEKNYFAIAGYDLTGYQTDEYKDWYWDKGEDYVCNQRKGKIQLFDDPRDGNYLYLGYILACGDEYDFNMGKYDVEYLNKIKGRVRSELGKLVNLGVINKEAKYKEKYQVIVFEEDR